MEIDERKYPKHPLVGVGVILFEGDKVLLAKRRNEPDKDVWTLPGGLVELGEPIEETAKREIFEETRLHINDLKIVDVVDLIERDEKGKIVFHYVLVDFLALKAEGSPEAGTDASDVRFFPMSDIAHLGAPLRAQKVINKAFKLLKETFKNENL